MGIKTISENKHILDFMEGGRGSKRHKVIFYGSKLEAIEKYNFYLQQFGKRPSGFDMNFKALAKDYDEWCRSQRGYDRKKYIIEALVKEFGGHKLIGLNQLLIEKFQTRMLLSKSIATVNNHIACLKHMLHKGADWGMPVHVYEGIKKVKIINPENQRLRFLTRDEADRLISKCSKHLAPIVELALNTGMRRGEILNLTWDRVDLQNGNIMLTQKDTKGKSIREVPLNETAKRVLSAIVRRLDVPYVFHENGSPYLRNHKAFVAACTRAKLVDFHFHDLRHTYASWLVQAGISLQTVKELLGHKTLTMTLRYAHLAPGHKHDAVRLLDSKALSHVVTEDSE